MTSAALPEAGPGSAAPTGVRVGAFLVDSIASSLIAALFTGVFAAGHGTDRLPGLWSLVPFAVDYLVGLTLTGRTLGMYLVGLRVVRADRPDERITLGRALIRTVLLVLLVPAVVFDRDRRGLHDRVSDTVVVRA